VSVPSIQTGRAARSFSGALSPDLRYSHWEQCPDLESDDIAASQLAVDGEIEHRQITRSLLDLELGPDCPNVLLPERWLGPYQLSFVPRYPLECR